MGAWRVCNTGYDIRLKYFLEVGAWSINLTLINSLHPCFNSLYGINYTSNPGTAEDKNIKTPVCFLLRNLPTNP